MKNANLALRTSLFTQLTSGSGIVYANKKVGVFEEYYAPATGNTKALFNVGTSPVEAYIILLNQTNNNDPLNKCGRNDELSIQIQINTVWPASKGGSKVAEEISNLILAKLFPDSDLNATVVFPNGFVCWKANVESTRNINFDANESRSWIVQMLLILKVSQ